MGEGHGTPHGGVNFLSTDLKILYITCLFLFIQNDLYVDQNSSCYCLRCLYTLQWSSFMI